jgi:hypothetical protein
MTKAEFIYRVMLIMNEATMYDTQGNSYIGADTAQIDRHIEGSYVDSWRRCAKVMPRSWLGNKILDTATTGNHVKNLADGTGYVIIPNDFYLLSKFKMSGWQKPVLEVSLDNERVSSIQSNEFTRGSSIRPVCVIDNKVIGTDIKPVLSYYSLPKGLLTHTVEEAIYVPAVESLKDKADDYVLTIDSRIVEPLAYLAASTVFTIFEKYEVSKALDARAEAMFPGLVSVKGTNQTNKQ